MSYEGRLKWRWGLVIVAMSLLLYLVMDSGKADLPPGLQRLHEAEELGEEEGVKAQQAIFHTNYRMADISLAVREQVDFLLTPALLVQEAVSDGVVLTYPEE